MLCRDQAIPCATNCEEGARHGGLGLDLPPQFRDMNIDSAGFNLGRTRITPHFLEQLLARHRAFAMRLEIDQHIHRALP